MFSTVSFTWLLTIFECFKSSYPAGTSASFRRFDVIDLESRKM